MRKILRRMLLAVENVAEFLEHVVSTWIRGLFK